MRKIFIILAARWAKKVVHNHGGGGLEPPGSATVFSKKFWEDVQTTKEIVSVLICFIIEV